MLERLVSFNWDQVASQLQWTDPCTGLTISDDWPWSDLSVCAQSNRIFVWKHQLIYGRTMVIKFRTPSCIFYSNGWSVRSNTTRLYVCDLKSSSIECYCCFSFYLSRSNSWCLLKSLLLHWWYTILSITFLNRWVFAIVNDDSTYLFSPRSSTSTGVFPIWWPIITTDIWNPRRKWSKLHVIYFYVLIINWAGIM